MLFSPKPVGYGRRAKVTVAALLACASMTALMGCENITAVGSTGVSVDAQARPVLVFAVCSENIVGATISRDRSQMEREQEDPSVTVAEWAAASPVTPSTGRQAHLDVVAPADSWSLVGKAEPLRPGIVYDAHGWHRDNNMFTRDVRFTLKRLSEVRPGQVLTQSYDQAHNKDVYTVLSETQFQAAACPAGP